MEAKKNINTWFPIILTDDTDFKSPKLGLATGAINIKYSYQGSSSLSDFYPTSDQWKETGSGSYWLQMGDSQFINEGTYQVSIFGTGCLNYNFPVESKSYLLSDIYNYVNTVSGNITSLNNVSISEIIDSGNINNWASSTINYSEIVDSGNAAGWSNTTITNTINTISGNISDLNNITVADILAGSVDGKTVSEILEIMLSMAQGKIERSGDVYTYKKQNNSTTLFTLTLAETSRTRS